MTSALHQRGLWPLRPPPRDNERIDHWLRRVAKAYGLTTAIFCHHALGLPPGQLHLLRTNPPDEVLTRLEAGTGISIKRLKEMTEGAMMEKSRKLLAESLQQDPYRQNISFPPGYTKSVAKERQ
jgi:hypothetical protein